MMRVSRVLLCLLTVSFAANIVLLARHPLNWAQGPSEARSVSPLPTQQFDPKTGDRLSSQANYVALLSKCHKRLDSRDELPYLLNEAGLTGEGVEVGVRRGHYSEVVLTRWHGRLLHLVDPWEHQPDDTYKDVSNAPQTEHDDNLAHVRALLGGLAPGRFRVHQQYSVQAAATFADESLDFVYIDARHDYAGVLEDLEAWYSKLVQGGLLAGHDFVPDQVKPREGEFGVQRAVFEFAKRQGKEAQSISTKNKDGGRAEPQWVDGGWTTFYWFK